MLSARNIRHLTGIFLLAGAFLHGAVRDGQAQSAEELSRLKEAIEARQEQEATYRQQAGSLKREVTDLQQQMIDLAAELQKGEEAASRTEEKITALSEQEARLSAATDAERARQSETLSALMRISREPPTSLALRYDHPVDAARAAMVMSAALPALEARARDLGEELAALRAVRDELSAEREALARTLAQLEEDRNRLNGLVADKKEARTTALDLAAKMKEEQQVLAKNAENVAGLLAKLEEEAARARAVRPRAKPDTSDASSDATQEALAALSSDTPISTVRGNLLLPARGRIVQDFGIVDRTGGHTKGMTFQTRTRAQVIAPHSGEVLFSGPFKGYGQVLIISAGEGYHILLAGLARIDSVPGQILLRGEPVGQMGSSDQTARLYVEIREQGTPVNPALWLAMDEGKARG